MRGLVLSLFPGIDLLGKAFAAAGWCVVRGPEWIMAEDIRGWEVPSGRFDGVIGGPPCQSFSALANLVRAKGLEPKFGNLIPEFERCVVEASPTWWLCENVENAPIPQCGTYKQEVFVLSPRHLGDPQSRRRRFTFGSSQGRASLMSRIEVVALEPVESHRAITRDAWPRPVKLGGSGKIKRDLNAKYCPRLTFHEMCAIQGFPELAEHEAFAGKRPTWTKEGARQALGNGVPRILGSTIAEAINEWLDERGAK